MPGPNLSLVLGASAGAILVMMLAAWSWSVQRKDAGVADIFWGLGFVLVAGVSLVFGDASGPRKWLLPGLVALWGVRLAVYLGWRNLIAGLHPGNDLGETEDRRYRAMRRKHGERFWWVSLFTVFGLQGVLLWIISLPLQVMQAVPGRTDLDWHDYLGTALVLTGLLMESVADWQLSSFRMNPGSHGQVLNTGLWKYSRHPNYFGEFLIWWGVFTVALGSGQELWVTAVSPLLMSVLLLKVSGVALTEKGMSERRPAYRDYVARTSAFVPWPPKQVRDSTGQRHASAK